MKFKLLTQNLWLLPFLISPDNGRRIKRFCDYLMDTKPDFVLLQEVWRPGFVRAMQHRLGDTYAFVHNNHMFVNRTGLVTLSLKPLNLIQPYTFALTPDHTRFEKIGKKGALRTEFIQDGERIHLINTHLYERKSPEVPNNLAIAQFHQLKYIAQELKVTTFIAGDLNLDSDELAYFNQDFFYIDENKEFTVSGENSYKHKRLGKPDREKRTLDHILHYNPNGKNIKVRSWVNKEFEFSDHYGLIAEIDVN